MIEQNLHKSKWVLFPHSKFKLCWDIIQIVTTLYLSISIPLNLSFGLYTSIPIGFEMLIEFIQILDVVISLNSGFHAKGIIVMSRKIIIQEYLKSWFVADFLTAIPIYMFFYPVLN